MRQCIGTIFLWGSAAIWRCLQVPPSSGRGERANRRTCRRAALRVRRLTCQLPSDLMVISDTTDFSPSVPSHGRLLNICTRRHELAVTQVLVQCSTGHPASAPTSRRMHPPSLLVFPLSCYGCRYSRFSSLISVPRLTHCCSLRNTVVGPSEVSHVLRVLTFACMRLTVSIGTVAH